ncbi:MAG: shikimate kinase [Symploca sp. SIO3C6]|uniref:Shikimate kinase n=1 Tax=Symploca sp. SIO1C4 TaxID=2607765 RepID=A0A6B3ND68_9CYAN|nr:shikimate kinase [Symploca sp. SIO3C6]NER28835.1 shikimate kinase [Symploca sp. SIO1C4]NET05205.1 shikimate kinase [Symploca sp. SIO2B6]
MCNSLLKGINVFLVGMMGVGKTTIGVKLATELGYRFVDTDALIEQLAGHTISHIFAESGEENFRQLETKVLSEVSAYQKLVIATGGGIILNKFNWSYLRHGLVIWLDAPVEVLIQRLQGDLTRPLLQQTDPAQALQTILGQRKSLYAQADLQIRINAEDTPEKITSRIIAEIPSVMKLSAD